MAKTSFSVHAHKPNLWPLGGIEKPSNGQTPDAYLKPQKKITTSPRWHIMIGSGAEAKDSEAVRRVKACGSLG